MRITWEIRELELASPFRIAKGSFSHRRVFLVGLEQGGHIGYGEATEITYYNINVDELARTIAENERRLSSLKLVDTDHFYELIKPILGKHPFLLSAFDCAAHDLFGKIQQQPLHKIWKLPQYDLTATFYTIGLGPIKEMQEKVKSFPWPRYKIKLAGQDDVEILRSLREVTPAPFLVDANEAGDGQYLKRILPELAQLNVIAIEQPLHRDQVSALADIQSPIPVLADESCQTEDDIIGCADLF